MGAPDTVDAIAPSGELIEAERQAGRVTVDTRAVRAWAQWVGAAVVASTASKQGRGTSGEGENIPEGQRPDDEIGRNEIDHGEPPNEAAADECLPPPAPVAGAVTAE